MKVKIQIKYNNKVDVRRTLLHWLDYYFTKFAVWFDTKSGARTPIE